MKKISLDRVEHSVEPIEIGSNFTDLVDSIADMSGSACQNCPLHTLEVNKDFVQPSGYPRARIMFVGMNPSNNRCSKTVFGGDDDRHKEIIDKMLTTVGLTRADTYFTNILKCSTADNKFDEEAAKRCYGKFVDELAIVDPELIVCFGESVLNIFGVDFYHYAGPVKNGDYLVARAYHPSYFLRKGGVGAEDNLLQLKETIDGITKKNFINLQLSTVNLK